MDQKKFHFAHSAHLAKKKTKNDGIKSLGRTFVEIKKLRTTENWIRKRKEEDWVREKKKGKTKEDLIRKAKEKVKENLIRKKKGNWKNVWVTKQKV